VAVLMPKKQNIDATGNNSHKAFTVFQPMAAFFNSFLDPGVVRVDKRMVMQMNDNLIPMMAGMNFVKRWSLLT
jgi:hypothetical protein